MPASNYAEIGDVKIVCGIPAGDTSRDDLINYLIPKVSRHIDQYCKRFFWPRIQSQVYDWQSTHKLWLRGDLQTLTSITNGDDTTFDLTKILKYPIVGPPYQWLEVIESSSAVFVWNSATRGTQQCITVTGVWGYLEDGATPEAIKDACSAWISYLLKVGKLAGVKSTTIGDYTVSYSNVLDFLRNGPPNESSYYLENFVKRRFATTSKSVAP